jgi:hypothetical protein
MTTTTNSVELISNVEALWGTMIRTTDNNYDFAFEIKCDTQYTFPNGDVYKVKLAICGVETVSIEDNFLGGYGNGSHIDEDDDLAYVSVKWRAESDAESEGRLILNGGTGKWEGATGDFSLKSVSRQHSGYIFPLTSPFKSTSIHHGKGQMTKPK